MAYTKTDEFSEEQIQLSAFAGGLSHPARIAIIEQLSQLGECTCGQVVDNLPLAQSTVSQHLHSLQSAGLVNIRQCGNRMCYSLNLEQISRFCKVFQGKLGHVDRQSEESNCCCEDC